MNASEHQEPPEEAQPAVNKISRRRLVAWTRTFLVYGLIFILASVAGNLWMTREHSRGAASPIRGQAIDGSRVEIDFKQGSGPVLLYFFADWCPVCRMQNPVISSLAEDVRVIGIAMQSGSLDQVMAYAREHGLNFEIINDESGHISLQYAVRAVPATFVVDDQQQIQFSTMGYVTEPGLRARLWFSQ